MIPALGLDLGASGIRAWHEELAEPIEIIAPAPEKQRHQEAILLATKVAERLAEGFESVCLGLSGFSSLNVDKQELSKQLAGIFSAKKVIVTSDMVTPHYSNFGESDGIVAAVGTGTLFFGVSPNGQSRIDGLGATLGDYGSAYWIGREAIRRSSREFEIGNKTSLFDALQTKLGDYYSWPQQIAAGKLKTFEIAQLSRLVTEWAEKNDSLAEVILNDATELIAESIIALSKRLDVKNVALTGGVIKSTRLLQQLLKTLEHHNLQASLGSGSAVVGSFQLAKRYDSPRIRFLESEGQLCRFGA